MLARLKIWASTIRRDVLALYLVGRDPRAPWYVKALAVATAAYALSPIDLIPDFIPVLGYLDDLVLVPLAIVVTIRMIPPRGPRRVLWVVEVTTSAWGTTRVGRLSG